MQLEKNLQCTDWLVSLYMFLTFKVVGVTPKSYSNYPSSDLQISLCIRIPRGLAEFTSTLPSSSSFNSSEVRTMNLHFKQVPRWYWYYWSGNYPLRTTVIDHFQSILLGHCSTPNFPLSLQCLLAHLHSQLMIISLPPSPEKVKQLEENLLTLQLLHLLTHPLASVLTLQSWLFWKMNFLQSF